MEDAIYVAVNQDVRESKSTLLWTLKTLQFNKIFLLHVHLPFSLTTSSSGLTQGEIDAIQDSELKTLNRSLYKYRDLCINKGVNEKDVDTSLIPGYDVGEGIVKLIYQNNIKKLVMGAAADPHYSRGMSITSRKAEYVLTHAPHSCKVWFICKGKLIETRESSETRSFSPREIISITPGPFDASLDRGSNGSEVDSSPCPPDEYKCPITLEIMRDPYIAADGFTYEAEAFREYLRTGGGKKNSPKTLEPLQNHILIPNRTLRIIIKEWLEKHPNYSID